MQISANGIKLEVDVSGPSTGEPLLLVMGLGMQLIAWEDALVSLLVERGFRVIRFDNRDIGLSQGFDHLGVPNMMVAALKATLGLKVPAVYSLDDMAADAAGLLDALGIARAHVCGISMGGMIAQLMAAQHPRRVGSLTLLMTSSGSRRLPGPSLKLRSALLSRPPRPHDVESVVAHGAGFFQLIGSPLYPQDIELTLSRVREAYRRSYRPAGSARQLLAVAAAPDRRPLLRQLRLPCEILHGVADPLIPVAAARDLHASIPGAGLDLVDGMGHDLPAALLPRIAGAIARAAGRA